MSWTDKPRQNGSAGRTGDRPPVVPERITILKASYRQTWLYFLLGLCLVVAWAFPVRILVLRMVAFRPAPKGIRDAHAFVTLAYDTISEREQHVSPKRFREQLDALRAAGYIPIRLEDVRALYRENQPLPRKAILMTFDQSRKSSFFEARLPLRRAGWPAVVFLWTEPIVEEDPASLRWPYVRTMLLSGGWEAGAQSHEGFTRIIADSAGNRRNFMSSPAWFAEETRYETPAEFSRRLIEDHEIALGVIQSNVQFRPLAFAFPYGDFGQYDQRAVVSRRLNMDLVGRYYDLGFVLGQTALNTRHSDPRRLSRLLVDPRWSAEDLLARLENAWPQTQGYAGDTALSTPAMWIPDWGDFALTNGGARFAAGEQTTGAKVWLNGSDMLRDFHARLRIQIGDGQFGIFLRATPDGEEHVYLGLGDDGNAWLRQKHAGMRPFTLSSGHFEPDENGGVEVDLFARDCLFYVLANGQPIFREIVQLRGCVQAGMLGYSVWHPEAGKALADLTAFDLEPFRPSAVTWTPDVSPSLDLPLWLGRNAYRFSHLVSPWMQVTPRGAYEQYGWNPELFSSFASVYRMRFIPEIQFDGFESLNAALPEQLAEQAAAIRADGVLLDLSETMRGMNIAHLTTWLQQAGRQLADRDLAMLIRLPRALAQAASVPSLMENLPNAQVVADSATPTANQGSDVLTQETAPLPYPDIELTLYYELSGLAEPDETWSTEMHAEWLRQEGRSAFRAGDFEKAKDIWRRWSEIDSANEEPLSLVGDVFLRQGDIATALAYYRLSLDTNPGQIGLVVRIARLMDQSAEDPEGAMELLNRYAHVFPRHPDIALAQAEWLTRRGRRREAGELIARVLNLYPENLRARTMLHGLLSDPKQRQDNLRSIVSRGARSGLEPQLASAIRERELFTLPESWVLMEFIEEMAARAPEPLRELYVDLLPRDTVAYEDFRTGRLSSDWISSIEYDPENPGSMVLAADTMRTEAYLRLSRSDAMHNGFIEAQVDEPRGFLWLYARRGAGNMVRFGFDHTGPMYLQVWRNGQIVAMERRFWARPDRTVRMRLEIQGDGAQGYIDGEAAFPAPVAIPRDMGLGWWGIAPWAPQFGMAQVIIREIQGGPLPVHLGWFQRRDEPIDDKEMVELLKPHISRLTAVAPSWYRHELDGAIRGELNGEFNHMRIFARYHRVRLLPAVRTTAWMNVDLEELIRLAEQDRVDGFTLLVPQMPAERWFAQVEEALIGTTLTVVIAHMDEENQIATLREAAPYVGLFPGARKVRRLPLLPADSQPEGDPEKAQPFEGENAVLIF